jgi:hypothetical protein
MADLTDTEAVLESIKAGDHDEQLVGIIEAVRLRFTYGSVAQKWKLAYTADDEDFEVREDDLTLGESRTVERLAGTNWGLLNPASTSSECLAIIAACLHHRHGKALKHTRDGPSGEAWDLASKVTATQAAEAISAYQVDTAPKD